VRAVAASLVKWTTTVRQGNRVKESCGEEACEEVVVPGGGLASEAQ
jgi:hypothetical protein